MENSANKAIMIGVGIFVTVAITSGILFSSRFSEYDAFDGTTVTGVDVINAINKYGSSKIDFSLPAPLGEDFYSKKFDASITGEGDNIKITFIEQHP